MLPKPEKIRKKNPVGEQLDLVDSLSQEKKVQHKRRFVLILLLLTVGLSIGFWGYHFLKNFDYQNPFSNINLSFKLPEIGIDNISTNSNNLEKDVKNIISKDPNSWAISVYSINSQNKTFTFNLYSPGVTTDQSDQLIQKLSSLPFTSESILTSSLPQGTKIQELIDDSANNFFQQSLISIPNQQILFNINIAGSNLDNSKKIIPAVVEKIYWQIMELNH